MNRRATIAALWIGVLLVAGCATKSSMRQEYVDQLRLYTNTVRTFTRLMNDDRVSVEEATRLMELKRRARGYLAAMATAEQRGDTAAFDRAYAQYAAVMTPFVSGVLKRSRPTEENTAAPGGRRKESCSNG